MEKTEQKDINRAVLYCINGLIDTIKIRDNTIDIIKELLKFEGNRVDSLNNKVDILMSERCVVDESIDNELDSIAETTITPRALIELGFEEMYQDVDYGEPGYIFYSHEIKGVGFYSVDTDDKDFHIRMDNSDYEIRNLRKLRDLILSLNEVN
tara:strand:- start:463 stop:921 length:459 start_codon:yes stop_codon:yes gene_type:complete